MSGDGMTSLLDFSLRLSDQPLVLPLLRLLWPLAPASTRDTAVMLVYVIGILQAGLLLEVLID